VTDCLEPRCSINQNDRVVNEMFLAVFSEEHFGSMSGSGWIEGNVEKVDYDKIDSDEQS